MRLAHAAVLLLAAGIGGCAGDPPPPDRYYRIEVTAPAKGAAALQTLLVDAMQAHGIYAERSMLYRATAEGPIERYYYHHWAEPPDMMLGDALATYLRAMHGEQQVFEPAARVRHDIVVRTRLRRIEQIREAPVRAALALRFTVSDAQNKPLFTLDFEEEETAADGSVMAYADAVDRLAGRAFAALAARLQEPLSRAPPASAR